MRRFPNLTDCKHLTFVAQYLKVKKKLLFATLGISISYLLPAQTNIGFKAGYNYSTARVFVKNLKQKTDYMSGYSFGIMFKAPFEGVLHFSPYAAYNRRGYIYFPDSAGLKKIENTIHYIDIAPGVSFDFPTNNNSTFIVGFSPVFGFAISGREKNIFSNDSVTEKKMILNFSNYGVYDIGITANIAYRYGKKFLLEASYYYSFANIENNDLNKRNIQNRMFNISLGYYVK